METTIILFTFFGACTARSSLCESDAQLVNLRCRGLHALHRVPLKGYIGIYGDYIGAYRTQTMGLEGPNTMPDWMPSPIHVTKSLPFRKAQGRKSARRNIQHPAPQRRNGCILNLERWLPENSVPEEPSPRRSANAAARRFRVSCASCVCRPRS